MEITQQKIDLRQFRGQKSTAFTGRPQGRQAREALELDKLDRKENIEVFLEFPSGTTSINPSFFLGLLFDSINYLGVNDFNNKYKIVITDDNDDRKRILQRNINDGLRSAYNEISMNKNKSKWLSIW